MLHGFPQPTAFQCCFQTHVSDSMIQDLLSESDSDVEEYDVRSLMLPRPTVRDKNSGPTPLKMDILNEDINEDVTDSGQNKAAIQVKHKVESEKWTHHHLSAFILTFSCYALFHATRKTISNTKYTLSEYWSPTNTSEDVKFAYEYKQWNAHNFFPTSSSSSVFLGLLDLLFLLSYSAGLFFNGYIGDRLNLRYVLTFGMISSAISVFIFGCVTTWAEFYSEPFYGAVWCINGFLQATGWPCVVAVIGRWFGRSSRGFVLGIWSANASTGNIIGSITVGGVLKYGFEYAYFVTSTMLFAGGIVIFFGLLTTPTEVGLPEAKEDNMLVTDKMAIYNSQTHLINDENYLETKSSSETKALPFFKVILLPGVIPYSLAYACLKPINYAFFFWLPYYLSSKYHWDNSVADNLSTWYDVGGIVGGIIFGYISDRLKIRSPVMVLMIILSPITIYFYQFSPKDKVINGVLMGLIGIFLNGAASILSTAITADLGRQKAIQSNESALSTVTGVIDGFASFSAAIFQICVPLINKKWGWEVLFTIFMVMTAFALMALFPPLLRDVKEWRENRRLRRTETHL